jgi:hypothetical protein
MGVAVLLYFASGCVGRYVQVEQDETMDGMSPIATELGIRLDQGFPDLPVPDFRVDAFLDATADSSADAGELPAQTCPINAPAGAICSHSISLKTLERTAGCTIFPNVRVGEVGKVAFPCSGDGNAAVVFGEVVFTGQVIQCMLSTEYAGPFDWSDGCDWSTSEKITGSLTDQSLTYDYEEHPLTTTGCAADHCKGWGDFISL